MDPPSQLNAALEFLLSYQPNHVEEVVAQHPIICHTSEEKIYTSKYNNSFSHVTALVPSDQQLVMIPKSISLQPNAAHKTVQFKVPVAQYSGNDREDLAKLSLAIAEEIVKETGSSVEASGSKGKGTGKTAKGNKKSTKYYQEGFLVVKVDVDDNLNKWAKLKIAPNKKTSSNSYLAFRSLFGEKRNEKTNEYLVMAKISTITSDFWSKLNDKTQGIFKTVAKELKLKEEKEAQEQIAASLKNGESGQASTSSQKPPSKKRKRQIEIPEKKSFSERLPDTPARAEAIAIVYKIVRIHLEPDQGKKQDLMKASGIFEEELSHTAEDTCFDIGNIIGNIVTPTATNPAETSTTLPNIGQVLNPTSLVPMCQTGQMSQSIGFSQTQQQSSYTPFTIEPVTPTALNPSNNNWPHMHMLPNYSNQANFGNLLGNNIVNMPQIGNQNNVPFDGTGLLTSQPNYTDSSLLPGIATNVSEAGPFNLPKEFRDLGKS